MQHRTTRRPGAAAASLVVALVLFVGPVLAATPATAGPERRADGVRLQGHGYGHGKGMSQWGAEGAARQGKTYRQILRFYYPGTSWGKAGGQVKVLISADTSDDVVVSARSGLKVTSLGNGKSWRLDRTRPKARTWRIKAASTRSSLVQWRARTGGWKKLRVVRGDAEFAAGGKPVRLHTPSGQVSYRGALRSASARTTGKARDTVNVLPLDDYLKGVVPSEVYASVWRQHAIRAQAVAARTYAAWERREPLARHYQICDTTQCQVYGGHGAEHPATNQAIAATRRQVLTKHGRPAFTQFSASSGGWTAAGSFPYLTAKQDPYDGWSGNPHHTWTHTIPAGAIEAAWPHLGSLVDVTVTRRNGHGDWGGRVVAVRVRGSKATTTVTGDTFRTYFGLKSDWFRVR